MKLVRAVFLQERGIDIVCDTSCKKRVESFGLSKLSRSGTRKVCSPDSGRRASKCGVGPVGNVDAEPDLGNQFVDRGRLNADPFVLTSEIEGVRAVQPRHIIGEIFGGRRTTIVARTRPAP